jgi:hypothetical protein
MLNTRDKSGKYKKIAGKAGRRENKNLAYCLTVLPANILFCGLVPLWLKLFTA